MASNPPTLHMLCGKIASGKSTLARRLADADGTVLLVEDEWLKPLYGDELKTLKDYGRCTRKLRAAMTPHVSALLNANVSVVLDFAANTPGQRAWMRGLLDASGAAHLMHVLNVSDAKCLARLHARSAEGKHPFTVTEAQFDAFSSQFVRPTAEEGFDLVSYDEGSLRA
jgi:predicted kinase